MSEEIPVHSSLTDLALPCRGHIGTCLTCRSGIHKTPNDPPSPEVPVAHDAPTLASTTAAPSTRPIPGNDARIGEVADRPTVDLARPSSRPTSRPSLSRRRFLTTTGALAGALGTLELLSYVPKRMAL